MDELKKLIEDIKKAREQGNLEEVKKLQTEWLRLHPNDKRALGDLSYIARLQGDLETEEKLLERRFELEPTDCRTIIQLVNVAKARGNLEKVRKWQTVRLKIEPENKIAILDLIEVAKKQKSWTEVKRLQEIMLEKEPENKKAKRDIRIATKHIEKLKTESVSEYRKQLKEGKLDVESASVVIEELKQTGGVKANILIAEIQARVMGLPQVSARFLQGCKKVAQTEEEKKAYSRAIEIVKQNKNVVLNQLEDIEER